MVFMLNYHILTDTFNNSAVQQKYKITTDIIKILQASMLNIWLGAFTEGNIQTVGFWVLTAYSFESSEKYATSLG